MINSVIRVFARNLPTENWLGWRGLRTRLINTNIGQTETISHKQRKTFRLTMTWVTNCTSFSGCAMRTVRYFW